MPLTACLPNKAPNEKNEGEGPDRNMAAAAAILSRREGDVFLKWAPPLCLVLLLLLFLPLVLL